MINWVKIMQDFRIPFLQEGDSHCRPGWVQTHCPFCEGSQGWHLGFNLKSGYFNCWRCGFHPSGQTVQLLTGMDWQTTKQSYDTPNLHERPSSNIIAHPRRTLQNAPFPFGTDALQKIHRDYLRSRDFLPKKLEKEWNLKGIGNMGKLKNRILIPILREGRIASWQARDVTGKASVRYKACPKRLEAFPIKDCLYGWEKVNKDRGCVVVEGVTDVWRLGTGSVSTFGIQWTPAQALFLCEATRVFLLFDSGEEQAQREAYKLTRLLSEARVNVELINLGKDRIDPAELSQKDADYLMKHIGLR